jgi:hypothetical protein
MEHKVKVKMNPLNFSRVIEDSSECTRVYLPLVLARTNYEVILRHSSMMNRSQPCTTLSHVTNKSSRVITTLQSSPSRLSDAIVMNNKL